MESETGADQDISFEQISSLRKGDYIVIQDRPCQIFHLSSFKKRKHSKVEYTVYGKDLFSDALFEIARHDESVKVPVVKRTHYKIVAAKDDFLTVLDVDSGKIEREVQIPVCEMKPDDVRKVFQHYDGRNNFIATVLSAMGEKKVVETSDTAPKD